MRLRLYSLIVSFLINLFRKIPDASKENITNTQHQVDYWIHASSAGEMEVLYPLLEMLLEKKSKIVVSFFSPSAESQFDRIRKLGVQVIWSPNEGHWRRALLNYQPKIFFTAKYEAWPELWVTLSELNIPCVVVNAICRRSLLFCKWIIKILGRNLPRLFFTTTIESQIRELSYVFPQANISLCSDLRWTRIFARIEDAQNSESGVCQYISQIVKNKNFKSYKCGILGSFWVDDFILWDAVFKNNNLSNHFYIIVPHDVCEDNLNRIRGKVKTYSQDVQGRIFVVDRMGVLLGLYGLAHWVYVGGGFSKGVHSTMEPAAYGVPISCGTRRVSQFPEIELFRKIKQLSIVADSDQLNQWLLMLDKIDLIKHTHDKAELMRYYKRSYSQVVSVFKNIMNDWNLSVKKVDHA